MFMLTIACVNTADINVCFASMLFVMFFFNIHSVVRLKKTQITT